MEPGRRFSGENHLSGIQPGGRIFMHELSIASDLVRRVLEIVERYPGSRAGTVTVAVGVYSGVDPSALAYSFPLAAEGTILRDVALVTESVAPTFDCRSCGASRLNSSVPSCTVCGSTDLALATGRELEITALELLDDEDREHGEPQPEDRHDTDCPEKQGARS